MMALLQEAIHIYNDKCPQLIQGYIRNLHPLLLPSDLIELIILFYDLIFHWSFKEDELQKLLTATDEATLVSKWNRLKI